MLNIKKTHMEQILVLAESALDRMIKSGRKDEYLQEDIEAAKIAIRDESESDYEEIFMHLNDAVGFNHVYNSVIAPSHYSK